MLVPSQPSSTKAQRVGHAVHQDRGSNEDLLDGSEYGRIQLVLAHLRPNPALEFVLHHWPIEEAASVKLV
jgi:hypothetical protein